MRFCHSILLFMSVAACCLPAVETSYNGDPWPVPSAGTFRLEAENYDNGGEGVAYHDTTPANQGNGYRLLESVDVEAGGITNVGYTTQGEWLRFTLAVAASGTYDLTFRVSNGGGDATDSLVAKWKGSAVASPISVANTGGWASYTDITVPGVTLSAGTGVLQLDFNGSSNPNLDWIEFTLTNAAPVAVAQTVAGTPTVGASSTVTATASDADGTVASVDFLLDGVLIGTDSDGSDGWSTAWTPAVSGIHTLTAQATDDLPQQGSPSAGIQVVVASAGGTNHAPAITKPVTLTVAQDSSGTVQIQATDADGDALGYSVTTTPAHGTASVSGAGLLSYTPSAGYTGGDTCTIQATDGQATDSVTIAITVTPPVPTSYNGGVPWPVAASGTFRLEAENFDNGGEGVAYHDTSVNNEGSAYRASGVDLESGGSAYNVGWTVAGEWLRYTLDVAASGTYDLTFRVCRGDGAAPNSLSVQWKGATVAGPISVPETGWGSYVDVTVTGVTLSAGVGVLQLDFPSGASSCPNLDYVVFAPISVAANTAPAITTAKPATLACDEDGSGGATIVATDADHDTLTFSISASAAHGTASVGAASGVVTYVPAADWNGGDAFTVQVSDGNGGTDTIIVNATVAAVNDAPTAVAQAVAGTPTAGAASTLAATATDIDGTVASVEFFIDGVSVGTDSDATGGWSVAWTPASAGTFTLTARATDDLGLTGSFSADVSVTVAAAGGTNTAPTITTAKPAALACDEDGSGGATIVATDADHDTLAFSISASAAHGTASVGSASGVVTYVPAANWNGGDSFTVQVSDGNGGTDTIIVNATVAAVNDAPVVATLTAPAATTVGASTTIAATAADIDGVVAAVAFYANGTLIGSDSDPAGGWSLAWTPSVAGTITISAVATDDLGLAGTARTAAPTTVSTTATTGDVTITSSGLSSGGCGAGVLPGLLLAALLLLRLHKARR